jgi:hypothetical protein
MGVSSSVVLRVNAGRKLHELFGRAFGHFGRRHLLVEARKHAEHVHMEGSFDGLLLAVFPLQTDLVLPLRHPLLRDGGRLGRVKVCHATAAKVDLALVGGRDEQARERFDFGQGIKLLGQKIQLPRFGQGHPRRTDTP